MPELILWIFGIAILLGFRIFIWLRQRRLNALLLRALAYPVMQERSTRQNWERLRVIEPTLMDQIFREEKDEA